MPPPTSLRPILGRRPATPWVQGKGRAERPATPWVQGKGRAERPATPSFLERCRGEWALALCAWLVLGLAPAALAAKMTVAGQIKNFRTAVTDESAHKTILRGREAKALQAGRYLILDARAETYRNDKLDLIIEAPECIYDSSTRIAASAGKISVHADDGRFSIAGEGFRLPLDEPHLMLSNNVRTVVRKQLLATNNIVSGSASVAPGLAVSVQTAAGKTNQITEINIFSDRFEYKPDLALFDGHVRAIEPGGELSCGVLSAHFDKAGGGLERLEADQNVRITQNQAEAFGDKAVYWVKSEQLSMTGKPTWKIEQKSGQSQSLTLNQKTREFDAEGEVYLRLPFREMVPADFLARNSSTNAGRPTNQFVEVRADRLNYRTNKALFNGHVRAIQADGALALDCGRLTVQGGKTNGPPEMILAEEQVQIRRGTNYVAGDQARYLASTESLSITGNPHWEIDQKTGSSGRLLIFPKRDSFLAQEEVRLTMPFAAAAKMDPSLATNSVTAKTNTAAGPAQAKTKPQPKSALSLRADTLEHKPELTRFSGNVRATDSEINLDCGLLELSYAQETGDVERIIAENRVRISEQDQEATGQKALYRVRDGLIELTGAPVIRTPDRKVTSDLVVLDRNQRTFKIKAPYRIELLPKERKGTAQQPPAQSAESQSK